MENICDFCTLIAGNRDQTPVIIKASLKNSWVCCSESAPLLQDVVESGRSNQPASGDQVRLLLVADVKNSR